MIICFIAITVVLITKNRKGGLKVWCSGVFDLEYLAANVLKKVRLLNSKDLAT